MRRAREPARIAPTQRLYPEARALLEVLEPGRDRRRPGALASAINALFLRGGLDSASQRRVALRLRWARLRRGLVDALGRVCPRCQSRLAELHRRTSRFLPRQRLAQCRP
jgi:hypothetical protein